MQRLGAVREERRGAEAEIEAPLIDFREQYEQLDGSVTFAVGGCSGGRQKV